MRWVMDLWAGVSGERRQSSAVVMDRRERRLWARERPLLRRKELDREKGSVGVWTAGRGSPLPVTCRSEVDASDVVGKNRVLGVGRPVATVLWCCEPPVAGRGGRLRPFCRG